MLFGGLLNSNIKVWRFEIAHHKLRAEGLIKGIDSFPMFLNKFQENENVLISGSGDGSIKVRTQTLCSFNKYLSLLSNIWPQLAHTCLQYVRHT